MTSTAVSEHSFELDASRLAARLARHAARRAQGILTVSILLRTAQTDPLQVLLTAHGRSGGRFVVTLEQELAGISRDLLRALAEQHDLNAQALDRIAELTGADAPAMRSAWTAKTARERALWLAHLSTLPQHRALRGPVQWLEQVEASATPSLLGRARQAVNALQPLPALCALAEFLPLQSWPLTCAALGTAPALSALATIADELPTLPLAALCSRAELDALDALPDARTRAILKEGVLLLPSSAAADTPATLATQPKQESAVLRTLESDAGGLLSQAKDARAEHGALATETDERARSVAERLLFERLQADDATRDCFELNGQMEFKFGPRAAEIDLVSRALRIAIEVDGYYHFTGPEAYRRDRRKDQVMQVQGFWVLRYLADDVVERGESIMNSIREAVRERLALAVSEKEEA